MNWEVTPSLALAEIVIVQVYERFQSRIRHPFTCFEAGQKRLADPNILAPGYKLAPLSNLILMLAVAFNAIGHTDYDWIFRSTPQLCYIPIVDELY
jgi:hypothetical protein